MQDASAAFTDLSTKPWWISAAGAACFALLSVFCYRASVDAWATVSALGFLLLAVGETALSVGIRREDKSGPSARQFWGSGRGTAGLMGAGLLLLVVGSVLWIA